MQGLPSSPSDTAATAATNRPQRPASSFRFEDVEERILQRTIALQKTKIKVPILGTSVEFLHESERREEEKRMEEEDETENGWMEGGMNRTKKGWNRFIGCGS